MTSTAYPPIAEGDDCPQTDHGHLFHRNAGRPFCKFCLITPRGLGIEREVALHARMRAEWHAVVEVSE